MPDLLDRRAMEAGLRELVAGPGGAADPNTPPARAQALLDRAFAERHPERRVRLAKQALQLYPDCADAYVLLAEHTRSRKEALALYQKGVAASERVLGPNPFQEDVGSFWGLLETRPYMRAREGLALSLWTAGRREEAVGHLQDMLRLNPGDNQGLRFTLAGFLLFLDRDEDLAKLLDQYPDEGMATWAYTKALLAFRQHGDTPEARGLLKDARKRNKHVPDYLLGRKDRPAERPGYYSPGQESEAVMYIGGFLASWKSTPGAIAWLRESEGKPKAAKEASRPKGPLGVIKKWLNERLAQSDDVWQADVRPLANWIMIAGEKVRPWAVLVTSRSNDLVLAHELTEEEPAAAFLWDTLVEAMQHPLAGEPHRPTELQVRPDERWVSLRPHVEAIGTRLVFSEELDQADVVFKSMSEHIAGKPEPGLLDMPAVTPEQVGSFYESAADFYRQAPWKQVADTSAIKVECGKFQSGPWYAVVMGQAGLTTGLALYEDLDTVRRLWAGDLEDRESARQGVVTSVTFGEEMDIPVADLEAARRYGWRVARRDAYPSVFHKERGLSVRPPLAWELELMEGCLRAVPDFVKRHMLDDPAREEVTVPVASGPLKLALSWVVEDAAEDGGAAAPQVD